ncbi:MAG: N-glycosylase/DNA lyase [Promethearchaeota archaeon]|nr:MAG: N-glycosylase/DNA lyase [Candidatus Lokiarchaeota archaeon]
MRELIKALESFKNSEIEELVNERIEEFHEIKTKSSDMIFKELCFCIMTANCDAQRCIEAHENIGNGFLHFSQEELANAFKENHYRFPNIRSKYISEAQHYIQDLESIIKSDMEENSLREWLVKNIKGLGYKEASHFLRNIGFKNYAIVDFHIVDVLVKYNLVKKPKTLTKKKYLEIEQLLTEIADKLDLNLAELDLYLWYMETGKILK